MAPSRVHCSHGMQRASKKSRHHVQEACAKVCSVLAMHPEYGVIVKGHAPLRKMRVKAPGLTTGKSGGYRLIYATSVIDECRHFALVALYYKGDREDLDPADYRRLEGDANGILGNVIDYDWISTDPE